ncbi:MAG: alpha/beta fold hydrolase [Candidatus Micrarchaeota archaeon]|nr:alpha/beta fold hydrolase [Candidatus Micrarchaeota archaeon]
MITENVYFKNSRGLRLAGIIDRPEGAQADAPAIVICHGFSLFKEFKPLFGLAQSLVEAGFVTLRFDFSNCIGASEGSCSDMTLSHQVNDLISAISFITEAKGVSQRGVGICGHSLGGLTAIVTATVEKRISSIVAIAPLAKAEWQNLFDEKTMEKWVVEGAIDFNTYRQGHVELHRSFIDDLREYDGTEAVKRVRVPIRFIHGENDTVVPLKSTMALFENANKPKDMFVVPSADHTFLKEPYLGSMLKSATEWMSLTMRQNSPQKS